MTHPIYNRNSAQPEDSEEKQKQENSGGELTVEGTTPVGGCSSTFVSFSLS
jgi:hypothetical protein